VSVHSLVIQLNNMFHLDTTHQPSQYTNAKITGDVDQQDDSVMDNVIISCTVGDEEALVDKAGSCSGSRRRLNVRQMTTTRQSEQAGGVLGMCVRHAVPKICKNHTLTNDLTATASACHNDLLK